MQTCQEYREGKRAGRQHTTAMEMCASISLLPSAIDANNGGETVEKLSPLELQLFAVVSFWGNDLNQLRNLFLFVVQGRFEKAEC